MNPAPTKSNSLLRPTPVVSSSNHVLCGKLLLLISENLYFLNAAGSNAAPLSVYSLFTSVGRRMVWIT